MLSLLLVLAALPKAPRLLFIGNSHTHVNDVPGMVRELLANQPAPKKAVVKTIFTPFLDDCGPDVTREISEGKWDAVILQAARVSSSHKYHYSQAKPIELARLALKSGSRVLLFAEWPRRGWDESEYQLGVYREIRNGAPGSEIVPICEVWDLVRAKSGGMDLWQPDGNHAALPGSYLAAITICRYLEGPKTTQSKFRPRQVSQEYEVACWSAANHIALQHQS